MVSLCFLSAVLVGVLAALLIIHTIAVVIAWIALRLMGTPARLRDVWHRF